MNNRQHIINDNLDDKTNKIINLAFLVGEIMLKNGAEAYRVESTMIHILKKATVCCYTEAFCVTTGVFISVYAPNTKPYTLIKRVHDRTTNLNNIAIANSISREFCNDEISVDVALFKINSIGAKLYPDYMFYLANISCIIGFSFLFGGTINEFLPAFIISIILCICLYLFAKIQLNTFLTNLLSCFFISINTYILSYFFKFNTGAVIISALMPLLPGTAITNSIRDTLNGDYMSGTAKGMEAIVIATSMAVGIAFGMITFKYFNGILY